MMTVHKLTAGDGYTYLTRQVAANDATARGLTDLGSYYSEKGETPGVWLGRGLDAVPEFPVGPQVSEAQMRALFGQGRHPNAAAIEQAATAEGKHPWWVDQSSRLGRPYLVYEQAGTFSRRTAGAYRAYNQACGLDPAAPVPDEERARIRTALARVMFAEQYGRDPADARELSSHLARLSRQATTAVAGYDLTFSPVKSVSTLWAIAPAAVAAQIERAHHDAVKDTLTWLEDHATYTRIGPHSVAQVQVHGLIAVGFTHRDSRAGDPDLHTHVAISNKVQTLDGRWLALDGRLIYRNNVAASERYNTRIEALLTERLGVRFADRARDDPAKRPVREIVGIDGPLPRLWSSRRAAIDTHRAVLSAQFQADHGRPPTPGEAIALAQQANLATRQRKHEPRSHAEQRFTWRTEALAVLGGDAQLHYYLHDALHPHRPRGHGGPRSVSAVWVAETADRVLAIVSNERATWQVHHVRAEAERQARTAGIRHADLDRAVDAVVTETLAPARSIALTPDDPVTEPHQLRRSDGTSVYVTAGSQLYTSPEILAAEHAILTAAGHHDRPAVTAAAVDAALHASTNAGVQLNPGQAHLVRELATSSARVQLALAPAGTGKTTTIRVLTSAWTSGIPHGQVIGLAPSAAAAAVLRDELAAVHARPDTAPHRGPDTAPDRPNTRPNGGPDGGLDDGFGAGIVTETIAKLLWHLDTDQTVAASGVCPEWVTGIGPHTLVVIDEAGMASTPQLATVIDYVTGRGGSVRLIGDNQQLAAIGAGGVLRDLTHTHGAVTLSQVMRFTHPAGHPQAGAANHSEGAASLALREGDPAAIGFYLDHDRVHVGDLSTVTAHAYQAWCRDRAAGRDTIMLAPTRELAVQLNVRARTDRLTHEQQPGQRQGRTRGLEVALADGSRASAGDTILTRRNDRRIPITARDWVKNGDRWTVTTVHPTGTVDATHLRTGRRVTLPADYVHAHVALGYASTVHGAQGITADTCHAVATGGESRQLLYVALTRGRHANHVYLATATDGDEHSVITRDALLPPTAADVLARILARDDSPTSATSQTRTLRDPALLLAAAADRYRHALATAAEDHLGADALSHLDDIVERIVVGVTRQDAYPTLRGHLALLTLDGHDPARLLTTAARVRGLGDARDVAAVLDWRLDPENSADEGALPWLPAVPDQLAAHPDWGRYLHHRATLIRTLAADVAAHARSWTPTSAPAWATGLLHAPDDSAANELHLHREDADLVGDLTVWRAVNAVETDDRRPTGKPLPAAAEARAQRALDQRVTRVLGDPNAATRHWAGAVREVDPRIVTDPYWPTLAARLAVADRAGIDITTLARVCAAQSPLPDEQPAAALWWRLSAHLSPAALTATDPSRSGTLRPAWTPALTDLLGAADAARVVADPAWPALVAAITNATGTLAPTTHDAGGGWEPVQLLETALDLLRGGQPDDQPLRPAELATALTWRIGLLTGTEFADGWRKPSDADRCEAAVPDDLVRLPEPGPGIHSHTEQAWLDALLADDATAHHPRDIHDAAQTTSTSGHHSDERRTDQAPSAPRPPHRPAWANVHVERGRLLELTAAADTFFADHYPNSWAAAYLTDRLGLDLRRDDRFRVGYAPAGWTTLTDHLRSGGASDVEIVAAGLGSWASTGRVIDRFRDRLVFPITTTNDQRGVDVLGFIGRRNPTAPDDGRVGPKYLNTADTALFSKRDVLFGLADHPDALAEGAALVLVEGPLDAIAVTVAGEGAYVGVAPLGTAFTNTQAALLSRHLEPGRPAVIVAFDGDRAGHQAAQRAFWHLTARGADPSHIVLPAGADPADLLHTHGPAALLNQLSQAGSLADHVIATRTAPFTDRLDTIDGRVQAVRRAADVVGALPPATWPERATRLAAEFGVSDATTIREVLAAGTAWTEDPRGLARQRLAEPLPQSAPPTPTPVTASTPGSDLSQQWIGLAERIRPGLTTDPHWPVLVQHLTRAAEHGYDVHTRLPLLVARHPLPDQHTVRDLDLRLINDYPNAAPPLEPATRIAELNKAAAAAEKRLAAASRQTPDQTTTGHDRHVTTPSTPTRNAPFITPPEPQQRPGISR